MLVLVTHTRNLDAFIAPQPYSSWTLNESTYEWESPIPQPELTQEEIDSRSYYTWVQELYTADNTKGWILITPQQSEA